MEQTTTPTPEELGYDTPESSAGNYLRLESKGQKVRIRIVSPPLKFVEEKTFPDKKTGVETTKTVTQYAWLVIHKELVNNEPVKTVKGYKAGAQVYGLIYDLVKNPEWGDPRLYDLEITRTEEHGKYYAVQPLPRPIGPLSEELQKLVDESGLDLKALFLGAPADEGAPHPAGDDDEKDPFAED